MCTCLFECRTRYTPLQQFLYVDALELLPDDAVPTPAAATAATAAVASQQPKAAGGGGDINSNSSSGGGSRGRRANDDCEHLTYQQAQARCLGEPLRRSLAELSVFVVGSGAIGCELLKNLALAGVSTGPLAESVVTDPDTVEASNLCRQFLFSNSDVDQVGEGRRGGWFSW
jgi:hypothetical protein